MGKSTIVPICALKCHRLIMIRHLPDAALVFMFPRVRSDISIVSVEIVIARTCCLTLWHEAISPFVLLIVLGFSTQMCHRDAHL
ncbi:hypothetical protein ALP64_202911 [Pseudomonas syringae pv. actinidiae]|nr:hypothetical protein ALP64_202911 [Pseudomonas syringae pv. actinidiae]